MITEYCLLASFETFPTLYQDWVPVLTLLDDAIQQLWKGIVSYGESVELAVDTRGKGQMLHGDEITMSAEDLGDDNFAWNSKVEKKKCTFQNHPASPGLISSHLKIPNEEDNYSSHMQQNPIPICHPPNYFKEQENEMDFTIQTEKLVQSWDHSLAKCIKNYENEMYVSDNNFSSVKDHFFLNEINTGERCSVCVDNSNFSSWWENDSFEGSINVSSGSAGIARTSDCLDSSDDEEMTRDVEKPFLKSCCLRQRVPQESSLFTDAGDDLQSYGFKVKKMCTEPYERVNISEIDSANQSFDFLSRTLWQDLASSFQHFPGFARKSDLSEEFDSLPVKSIPFYEESLDRNGVFSSRSVTEVDTIGFDPLKSNSKCFFSTSDYFSQGSLWDVEDYSDINIREGSYSFETGRHKHYTDSEENDCRYSYDVLEKRSSQENCTTSCSNSVLEDGVAGRIQRSYRLTNKFSPECMEQSTDVKDGLCLNSRGKSHKGIAIHKSQRDAYNEERERNFLFSNQRSRSRSALPFHRSKRKFLALNCHFSSKVNNGPAYPGAPEQLKSACVEDSLLDSRRDLKNMQDLKEDNKTIKTDERFEQSACFDIQDAALLKETISNEFQDSPYSWTKWQNCCPPTANNNKLHGIHDQNNILDISSGFLHLAGDFLVPDSINKNCLEDAIVLQQVDQKFIPVVAGRTLAIVDQHAADERIRLDELRERVLSGEGKTITFLEAEQELTLPEMGHQLLRNYAEEIKEWGWICNIHALESRSFKRFPAS